ncbi:MAG: hypothetical protein JWR63_4392, partial [Conexibacter sp.]|nr:hypothetical protein [Conexibacter sp.]
MPAYKEALVLPVAQVATELQDVLGQRLVAFAT